MFGYTSWWVYLLTFYLQSGTTANVVITSSPRLGAGTLLCDNQNVTLSCHTDQSAANITWHWPSQSEKGNTINVLAKLTKVVYTCVVSDDNGKDVETANVSILANGSAPHVVSSNFYHYMSEIEGSNLTLVTSITSNLPLSGGYPVWGVTNHQSLPPTAVVDNYTTADGILHNRLSLYDLSYYHDSGNYTNNASNDCGTSFVFAFIQVTKAPIVCDNPAHVTQPLRNVTMTVQGEFIQLNCLFKGNLALLDTSLTSYWNINLPPAQQHDGPLYVYDNSTDPYLIAVYQTCLTSNASCCNFINQLTIRNASLSLNNAKLTCTEGLSIAGNDKPVEYTSSTTIVILVIPRIISGPRQLDGQGPAILQCQFSASAHPGVTIVVWKRNNMKLYNSSLYLITQSSFPGKENHVVSTLMINSSEYYGTYTCYCYYNRSLVVSTEPVTSNEKFISLQRNKHGLSEYAKMGIGIGGAVTATIIIVVLVIIWAINRRRPAGSSDEQNPLLQADEKIKVGDPEEATSPPDHRIFSQAKQSTVFGGSTNRDSSSSRTASNAVQHEQEDTHSNISVDHLSSHITTAHQSLTNSTSVANSPILESGYQD